MSEQEQNFAEVKENLPDTTNRIETNSQIKLLMKSIVIIFLLLATLTTLICIGLLIQGYLNHHIAYEKIIFDIFDITFGIQEFYYLCWKTIGYSLLVIVNLIPFITNNEFKNVRIILFIISILFLLYYLMISFDLNRYNLEWENFLLKCVLNFTSVLAVFSVFFF